MSRPRVLIVDDEVDLVEMLAMRLEALGKFDIEKAYDGQEAIEMAKRDHPDFVLLDTVMPTLDGWQVCRELKADPQTKGAKIVVTTAGSQSEEKAKEAGADRLLLKPYEFDDLIGVLDSFGASA